MLSDPIAETIRKETELVIGRLVMQSTTLTVRLAALQKELDEAKAALATVSAGGGG